MKEQLDFLKNIREKIQTYYLTFVWKFMAHGDISSDLIDKDRIISYTWPDECMNDKKVCEVVQSTPL